MKWAPWVESLTIHIFKPAGIGAARVPFPQDAKIIAVQETTLMTCPPLGGSSGSLDLSGRGAMEVTARPRQSQSTRLGELELGL